MVTTSDLARHPPEGTIKGSLDSETQAQLYELAQRGTADGQHEKARDVLKGLVVLNRQNAKVWALLGSVEHKLKELDGACDALARALALSSRDWDVALELAEVHHERKEENEAQAVLTYVALESEALTRQQLTRLKTLGGH